MSKKFKVALVSALVGIYSIIPIATAKAADQCMPDTIGVKAFSVHPGQKVGFLSNGSVLTKACTKDDLGLVQVTYGPRILSTYSSGTIASSTTSWKWHDFTYEDLVALMTEAKITDTIDAQSVYTFNFFRGTKNAAGALEIPADEKPINIGIVLDPTKAGQCHPDKAALSTGTASVYKGSFTAQILNGITVPNPCSEKDPGWLYIGYAADGKAVTSSYMAYQPDWIWGGGFDYDWFAAALATATPPVPAPAAGSSVRVIFWRSNNSTNQPNLDSALLAPTADFTTSLYPTAAPAQPKSAALTISCVKGKVTKTVSGKSPKCPAGYKKK
jgi:hypothetical protein